MKGDEMIEWRKERRERTQDERGERRKGEMEKVGGRLIGKENELKREEE